MRFEATRSAVHGSSLRARAYARGSQQHVPSPQNLAVRPRGEKRLLTLPLR